MLLFTSDSFFSNQIKQFHFLFYIYDQLWKNSFHKTKFQILIVLRKW